MSAQAGSVPQADLPTLQGCYRQATAADNTRIPERLCNVFCLALYDFQCPGLILLSSVTACPHHKNKNIILFCLFISMV